MTFPEQEAHALDEVRRFMHDLANRSEKRIPSATRDRARSLMRHYPLVAGDRWMAVAQAEDRIAGLRRVLDHIRRDRHSDTCDGMFQEPEGCWGALVAEALNRDDQLAAVAGGPLPRPAD